jgi:hypothetical protein
MFVRRTLEAFRAAKELVASGASLTSIAAELGNGCIGQTSPGAAQLTIELLGIRWTQSSFKNISIADRQSVAILDAFVGPKS